LTEVYRVVESQSQLYAQQATSSSDKAAYLESVLESTKPKRHDHDWHKLIATPFRYPPPVPAENAARFRPPFYSRNVFYASGHYLTTLYEHGFHFLRQCIHLRGAVRESGLRTLFSMFIVSEEIADIRGQSGIQSIMDRRDYSASHAFILKNPEVRVLLYPSCRDSKKGDNYAVFDIHCLAKDIGTEGVIAYSFDPLKSSLYWIKLGLSIEWKQVS
jgi:hypothetical protein